MPVALAAAALRSHAKLLPDNNAKFENAKMNYTIVDPTSFVTGEMFREDDFLANTGTADWEQYRDRMVLVRGCGTTIVPPGPIC